MFGYLDLINENHMIVTNMAGNQRKRTSTVWQFFELKDVMEDGKKIKKALCKLCDGVNLAYSGGTSNLHNHLEVKHSSHLIEKDQEKKQLVLPGFKNCPPARTNNIACC